MCHNVEYQKSHCNLRNMAFTLTKDSGFQREQTTVQLTPALQVDLKLWLEKG
jgi:hypothetical protein